MFDNSPFWLDTLWLSIGAIGLGLYLLARRGRQIRHSEERYRLATANRGGGGLAPPELRSYLKKLEKPARRTVRWQDFAGLLKTTFLMAGLCLTLFFFGASTESLYFPLFITLGSAIKYFQLPVSYDDVRRPIVYLRSFKSDTLSPESMHGWFRLLFAQRPEGYEGALARSLAPFGPLVAVGEPGEFIPPFGAYRIYADHAHWQNVVAKVVEESQLVVLRPGPTEGLLWELNHILSRVSAVRILVFVPPADRRILYPKFRNEVSHLFPEALPENLGHSCFIAFSSDWKPVLLSPTLLCNIRSILQASFAPTLYSALRPICARLDLHHGHLPMTRGERAVLVF